jgi:hypothetical protein
MRDGLSPAARLWLAEGWEQIHSLRGLSGMSNADDVSPVRALVDRVLGTSRGPMDSAGTGGKDGGAGTPASPAERDDARSPAPIPDLFGDEAAGRGAPPGVRARAGTRTPARLQSLALSCATSAAACGSSAQGHVVPAGTLVWRTSARDSWRRA